MRNVENDPKRSRCGEGPADNAHCFLDAVYLRIAGRLVYWRVGEIFDVLLQTKRNNHAALKLMRKLSLTPHKRLMSAMPPKDRLSQLVRKSRMRDNKRAMNESRVNRLS